MEETDERFEPQKSSSGRDADCKMKRILLTGMSGTGKSTLIQALQARGFRAVDIDQPGWSEYSATGDWVWREERVAALLANSEDDLLFLSGCAENQVNFYPQLDYIILLSAPAEVLIERIMTRTNNSYGKRPAELAEVLHNLETIEPLLRRGATHEIDTIPFLEAVLTAVLTAVDERP